jgi:hypothetical protein
VPLAITLLNVYKPAGLTPYGWRKQREQRLAQQRTSRPGGPTALRPAIAPVGVRNLASLGAAREQSLPSRLLRITLR